MVDFDSFGIQMLRFNSGGMLSFDIQVYEILFFFVCDGQQQINCCTAEFIC